MARKKVTPEEEIVNTAVEGTALGSVPAGSVLHDRFLRPMKRTGALGSRPRKKPQQKPQRMNTWQMVTLKSLMHRRKRANARFSTNWTSTNWIGG